MSEMNGGKLKAELSVTSRLRSLLRAMRLRAPDGGPGTLSRRTALLAPLALAGCDTISGWFE